jgi:N-acetylmuramoyl-L-alanine amidase
VIRGTKIICSLLLICIFASVFTLSPSADYSENEDRDAYIGQRFVRRELSLKSVEKKNAESYTRIAVFFNERSLDVDARYINGVTYIALRKFVNQVAPNMNVSFNASTRTLAVTGEGLNLTARDGSYTITANGRALFNTTPAVIMTNTQLYVPLLSVAKAFSLSVKPGGSYIALSGSLKPLKDANLYYREDAVYWLSRIISAESRGESLLGQIAVGNIVMNRVASQQYPNTIWGVIFDKKYGVQFSPILDGTIYNTPTASAVEAAKIVLEGYTISEDTLFFLAPRYAQSSWIPNSRKYEFSIGNHDFYS